MILFGALCLFYYWRDQSLNVVFDIPSDRVQRLAQLGALTRLLPFLKVALEDFEGRLREVLLGEETYSPAHGSATRMQRSVVK